MLIVGNRIRGINTGEAKTSDYVFIFFERRQTAIAEYITTRTYLDEDAKQVSSFFSITI